MAEWRFGRGWTDQELEKKLAALERVGHNFPYDGPDSQLGTNWRRYYSESVVAREKPGPPGRDFDIAWKAIKEYQFSDPAIVTAHFKADGPVKGRTMLLELKVMGLHYLCGVRVTDTLQRETADETVYGWRYDTLEGHFEIGSEWFTLTKNHATGELVFRISASWRPGHFPNWWSHLGFEVVGRRYQLAWHRLAYLRLRELVGQGGRDLVPVPFGEKLVHTGAEISNSDLWILREPAGTRVSEAGKEDQKWPQYELDKSSLLPGPHQVSDAPPPASSRSTTRS